MFESAKEYLDKLRKNKVWVRGVLVNTLNREGNEFWYQLREPAGLNTSNSNYKESKVFLQFKAAGWLKATEYIDNLNRTQEIYKYVITGTVTVNCPKVDRTVSPPCS
ncbi:MAG: hypothetical protein KO464_05605 [Candidatus Methanofastidiosum sp.]|nr:hypothetical protein [Methanofastidiosum sp.]